MADHRTGEAVVPARAGVAWTETDNATLLDGLRNGIPLADLAVTLQRRESALQTRCKQMLPPGSQTRRADADLELREHLALDPDFDALANLRANIGGVWTPDTDGVLRHGWAECRPMSELVAAVAASEVEIAQRLVRLGVATNLCEVIDRVGCRAGGDLEIRRRMMADRAVAAVWVLLVNGLADGPHVSLHSDYSAAQHTLDELTQQLEADGQVNELTATLAERVVGSGASGATRSLTPTLSAAAGQREPIDHDAGVPAEADSSALDHRQSASGPLIVRWRKSGKVHVSLDGAVTVCGSLVQTDRAEVVTETPDWHLHTNCYNCAYRLGVPAGYVQPANGKDFPIRKKCCHDRDPRGCVQCTPTAARNRPRPNGSTDPREHEPMYDAPRCTASPPSKTPGPDGRCRDGCESIRRAKRRANPTLRLDLADSAMIICHHCGGWVCVSCQFNPVANEDDFCKTCDAAEAITTRGWIDD